MMKSGRGLASWLVFLLTLWSQLRLIKIQRLVTAIMQEKFAVEQVEDYALHEPPEPAALRRYIQEEKGGPDLDDLRIDMRHKISSTWNQKVLEILLEAVLKEKATGEDWEDLPDRSDDYYMDIILDQMKRARTMWRNAQPKVLESGDVESLAEVEKRMVESKEVDQKRKRATMRRLSVRPSIMSRIILSNGLPSDMTVGWKLSCARLKEKPTKAQATLPYGNGWKRYLRPSVPKE